MQTVACTCVTISGPDKVAVSKKLAEFFALNPHVIVSACILFYTGIKGPSLWYFEIYLKDPVKILIDPDED